MLAYYAVILYAVERHSSMLIIGNKDSVFRIVSTIVLWCSTTFLFYFYWIFQLHLILLNTRFFFPVLKLSLASALLHFSGFDHIFWTQHSVWLSTVLLLLLLHLYVWCSTGLSAGACAVCFVHYSTVRHHNRQSLSQPSAFCR